MIRMLVAIALLVKFCVSIQTWQYDPLCRLDAKTIYPWLVQIWDQGPARATDQGAIVAHGVLIAYKAVLSVCTPFGDWFRGFPIHEPTRYEVFAQYVNVTKYALKEAELAEVVPVDCTTKSHVRSITRHPKCENPDHPHYERKEISQLFNFAVYTITKPLPTEDRFPALPIPTSPDRFLTTISLLNIMEGFGCETPSFDSTSKKGPASALYMERNTVKFIPFQSVCLDYLCSEKPGDEKADYYLRCRELYGVRANATRLCAQPSWTPLLKGYNTSQKRTYGDKDYAGIPLVCNGTGFGMVSFIKSRYYTFPDGPFKQDFFFVVTFLRVWPWLLEMQRENGAPRTDWFLEQQLIKKNPIVRPSIVPIDEQKLPDRFPGWKIPFPTPKPKDKTFTDSESTSTKPFFVLCAVSVYLPFKR